MKSSGVSVHESSLYLPGRAASRQCRRQEHHESAGGEVSWAVNREFGLTPEQIEKLSPGRQLLVYKSIVAIGSVMIGKLVTKEIAIEVLKSVGVRMSAKQVGKYVPVAGQALSIALGFAAMKYVGHQHIKDCLRVVEATLRGEL